MSRAPDRTGVRQGIPWTLYRYLMSDYLAAFLLTLLVATFVMCLGAFIKAIDLMSKGIPGMVILRVFYLNIPFILMFSMPISSLTSVLLLFSRLSLDGEITAMKAAGLSLWRIGAPLLVFAGLLTGICLYINSYLAPDSHFARRQEMVKLGTEDPLALLDEGRVIKDYPRMSIFIGKRRGNHLSDIMIFELGDQGIKRSIRAREGTVTVDAARKLLLADLTDVHIEQPDPSHPNDSARANYVYARRYPARLDFSKIIGTGAIEKRIPDMTLPELVDGIRHTDRKFPNYIPADLDKERLKMKVDLSERIALAVACLAFTFVGMPLGVKSHRRESSAGIGVSLLVIMFFYLFIIIADSLRDYPELQPQWIPWVPILAGFVAGLFLIRRAN